MNKLNTEVKTSFVALQFFLAEVRDKVILTLLVPQSKKVVRNRLFF